MRKVSSTCVRLSNDASDEVLGIGGIEAVDGIRTDATLFIVGAKKAPYAMQHFWMLVERGFLRVKDRRMLNLTIKGSKEKTLSEKIDSKVREDNGPLQWR